MQTKIKSFTDLNAWKEAHKLVVMIYKITKSFPKEETYSLIDQMKRCSISITSNMAEGFSRQSKKEKIQFYFIAKGSLTELQNQLLVARDVGYLDKSEFKSVAEQTVVVHKLINGLIKSAKTKYKIQDAKY
jgi:four helix bundle protein